MNRRPDIFLSQDLPRFILASDRRFRALWPVVGFVAGVAILYFLTR